MKTVKSNKFKSNKFKSNKFKSNKFKIKSRKINKKYKRKTYKVGGIKDFINLFKKNKVIDENKDYDDFKGLIDKFININKEILINSTDDDKMKDDKNNCKKIGEIILENYKNKTCNDFMTTIKNMDFVLIENNNDKNITKINEHITKLNKHIKSALNNTKEYNEELNRLLNDYISVIKETILKEKDINILNELRYNLYKNTEQYFINSFDVLSIPKVINNIESCGIILVKKQEQPKEKEEEQTKKQPKEQTNKRKLF